MGDFNKKPGQTDSTGNIGTAPNLIAPGKRMLSSMAPTIVTKNGKIVLVTGSPGGRTIINTVLNVVLNVAAWGMNGPDAVEATRLDHEWMPDRLTIEAGGIPPEIATALKATGHEVRVQGPPGIGADDLGRSRDRPGLRRRRQARLDRQGLEPGKIRYASDLMVSFAHHFRHVRAAVAKRRCFA